jgi:PAS domain S-box-containing protein
VQHQPTHASSDAAKSDRGSPPLGPMRTTWHSLNRLHSGIGLRLFVRVLLFSSAITLLLTLIQLYLDYRRDIGTIDRRISEIGSSYRRSLAEGLWRLDAPQLQLQVDGILHLPDIRYVEVREATDRSDPMVVSAGSRQVNADMRREFPISYAFRGVEQVLGTLSIEAAFDGIYRRLLDRAAVIMVSQGVNIFFVSFFILLIVHRLITRHLAATANSLSGYDLRRPPSPLRLDRRPPRQADELDQLIGAFNGMSASLLTVYDELRASEERWRTVFQNAPVGIGTLNLDGKFLTANPTFQRMLGYGEDEMRSLTGLGITHEDDRAATRHLIDEVIAGGRQSYQVEKRYRRKDGHVIWVLVNTSIIPASGSTPAFFAGVVVDITEHKRAQEERERLHQLEADLAHMNRVSMMGELAGSLAHEITQPVGSAGNNARAAMNFLDQRPPDLSEVRDALGCVVSDTDRAGDIIDRIREHIKKAPPRKGRFDLNAAINEVIVLAHSAIIKNSISVETRLADGLLPVQGDHVQMQQVVLNLILNAIEAMGSAEAWARELAISTEQTKTGDVIVAVRDSGPGIDPEHREHVFQAFYTTKPSGTGMGLSICRSIIDAHGGRLWAEANEPRGAVFQFTLPGAGRSS